MGSLPLSLRKQICGLLVGGHGGVRLEIRLRELRLGAAARWPSESPTWRRLQAPDHSHHTVTPGHWHWQARPLARFSIFRARQDATGSPRRHLPPPPWARDLGRETSPTPQDLARRLAGRVRDSDSEDAAMDPATEGAA
jgi:hypothetical protein